MSLCKATEKGRKEKEGGILAQYFLAYGRKKKGRRVLYHANWAKEERERERFEVFASL